MSEMVHLSEDQFAELMAGAADAAAETHLRACAACREELETVRASMESFSSLTLDWAERRSATLPPVRPAAGRGSYRPLVWAASAAAVGAAVFAGSRMQQPKPGPQIAVVNAPAMPATEAPVTVPKFATPVAEPVAKDQIAEDNRLMQAISRELSANDSLLLPPNLRGARARSRNRVND